MKTKLFLLTAVCIAMLTSCNSNKVNQDNSKTTETTIQAPADSTMMITATLTIKPDKIADFIAAAKDIIDNTHKEPGCISYQLYQDPYTPGNFIFVEEYKNQAAIDAHFAADYFKAFGPKSAEFTAAPTKIKIISVSKVTLK